MSKCALIVDDSRTARQALAAVLAANHLRVETAASAEEALEFLSHSRPDVIFMDHLMPGMDGLQAVKVIKANPATATIPIMMYTSQAGDLYVGQARALGAVGVLPKQIKPVEVSDLLQSLHLVETGSVAPPPTAGDRGVPAPVIAGESLPPHVAADPRSDLELWVQSLLVHQAQEIRAEVQTAVARALREHERARDVAPVPPVQRRTGPLLLLLLALAAAAVTFFFLSMDAQRKWRSAVDQNASLMAALNLRRATTLDAVNDQALQASERDAAANRYADFIGALEWGVNQAALYAPGSEPFAGQRLEILRGLVERLAALGFAGIVRLDGHIGDFCYASAADGVLALAPEDLPAERCTRIGLLPEEARAVSGRQSVAFANYLASRAADPALRIELVAHGAGQPAVPYPPALEGITAGEWNAVARRNNRVSISLLANPPPP